MGRAALSPGMSHSRKQTRRFARAYRKLHDYLAADVDAATEIVADNPALGERKKGDLGDQFVYKFPNQLTRLAIADEAVRWSTAKP